MQIERAPGVHTFRFEECGGLASGGIVLIRPYLDVTCKDCGWSKTFYIRRGRKRLDLHHDCPACTDECDHESERTKVLA